MTLTHPRRKAADPTDGHGRAGADGAASATMAGPNLFADGPLVALQSRLGLAAPDKPRIMRRALLVVLIGWVPLLLLSLLDGMVWRSNASGLFSDFAVHARSLVAAPLLIIAEVSCAPWLSGIAMHFQHGGLVADGDQPRFKAIYLTSRALLRSRLVEVLIFGLAYAITIMLFVLVPNGSISAWHFNGTESLSPAGWWHRLVSIPLLLLLLFAWVWRLCIWARFLWKMSRLKLQLFAAHPDRAAGLGFVGSSLRAFAVPALALGVIVAGTVANAVQAGMSPFNHAFLMAALPIFIVAMFGCPLLVFSGRLLNEAHHATLTYGAIASRLGRQFEQNWADAGAGTTPSPDPSTAADLSAVVASVYSIRMIPVDLRSILVLAGAAVLPFVPVLLMAIPVNDLLKQVAGLLF